MRIRLYITVLLILSCLYVLGQPKQDTVAVQYESVNVIPLQPNEKVVESLKKDKRFNYERQDKPGNSFIERVLNRLIEFLVKSLFRESATIDSGTYKTFYWIILGIVVLGFLLLLILFKPSLFYRNKKRKIDYRVEEEAVEEDNFEKLIRLALQSGNYIEAIRWRYLKTLEELQKKDLISWDPNKTVNEYVRELDRADLRTDFRGLSRFFLYFRYGDFEASREHYDEVEVLSENIIKRLNS